MCSGPPPAARPLASLPSPPTLDSPPPPYSLIEVDDSILVSLVERIQELHQGVVL
jgi:hypothetical protein